MMERVLAVDEQLFDAWQRGDPRAGDRLVARHDDAVRSFLERRVGAYAEDAVQNVWAAMTRCRDRFERRCSFRTYLFAVAKNQARETYRRRQRDSQVCSLDIDTAQDPAPGAASVIGTMQDARQLAHALSELPVDLQRLVALYYFERRTAKEIGEMFGVPENTARSRLRRAKELLRRQLRDSAARQGFEESFDPVQAWLRDTPAFEESSD